MSEQLSQRQSSHESSRDGGNQPNHARAVIIALSSLFATLAATGLFVVADRLNFGSEFMTPWILIGTVTTIGAAAIGAIMRHRGEDVPAQVGDLLEALEHWQTFDLPRWQRIAGPSLTLLSMVVLGIVSVYGGRNFLGLPMVWWLIGITGIGSISAARLIMVLRDMDD
jgi:hypothetical protein